MADSSIRVLYIQFAGDFRETLQRFRSGGKENYYGQEYSVHAVIDLAKKCHETTVFCCLCQEKYDEIQPEGVRTIGAGLDHWRIPTSVIVDVIERVKPTHIVLRFQHWKVLRRLLRGNINVLPLLAGSIKTDGWRSWLSSRLFAHYLNSRKVKWVGNHQISACTTLVNIGVKADKILPYDWEHKLSPDVYTPKKAPEGEVWNLFFAGNLVKSKGIEDALKAVAILNKGKKRVHLTVAGDGAMGQFVQHAHNLSIDNAVTFVGLIPNEKVLEHMRKSDLVFVLSHREYPEALPMTLMEAMVCRTPLITSDHPIFKEYILPEECSLIVEEKSPAAIASAIERLMNSPEEYENFSKRTAEAWHRIVLPLKWADIIESWLFPTEENQQRLRDNSYPAVMHNRMNRIETG